MHVKSRLSCVVLASGSLAFWGVGIYRMSCRSCKVQYTPEPGLRRSGGLVLVALSLRRRFLRDVTLVDLPSSVGAACAAASLEADREKSLLIAKSVLYGRFIYSCLLP